MIKIFTKFELMQKEGYDILSHILNEAELQIFYNTPVAERGTLIPNKTVRRVEPPQPKYVPPTYVPPTASAPLKRNELRLSAPPKVMPTIFETQKCTSTTDITKSSIYAMAMDYMGRDFEYQGRTFNMNDMGWNFKFINTKRSFGRCFRRRRRNRFTGEITIVFKEIQISEWLITNSESTFEEWVDTMLHEIAHAIDVEIRGISDHSYTWKSIAWAIGCDGNRTTDVKISHKNTKYTMTCINCNKKSASHKRQQAHRMTACSTCCKEYNGGRFTEDYLLIQTQNY